MDYKRNRQYFSDYRVLFAYCFFIGLALIIGGPIVVNLITDNIRRPPDLGWLIGLSVVGGIALVIYSFYCLYLQNSQLSDSDLDRICDQQAKNIKAAAMKKLGIDEDELKEAKPIIVGGYSFNEKATNILHKQGKDGMWRSSEYQITIIFFSREQVYSFIRTFSIIDNEKYDKTQEYFYRDIVSVSTEQGKMTFTPPGQDKNLAPKTIVFEYFDLASSGGTHMIGFFKKTDSDNIDRSIAAMRNLLKAKKQEMV